MRFSCFTILCGALMGCTMNTPTDTTTGSTSTPRSTKSDSTNVTANRPVLDAPDLSRDGTQDRTNTGLNVRDRDSTAKTPIDQNENSTDIAITADIRKRVVATEMSVNAQNAKIITQDGKVTLRGPVATDDEKREIESIATEVAGAGHVDNQLEVTSK